MGESTPKLRDVTKGLIPPQTLETVASKFRTSNGSLIPEKLAGELKELSGLQPSNDLENYQSALKREIQKTRVEIKSEIHSRLVFGTGCIPMILIGIGLGIIKKGGHLLTAFGASCVPAAVLVICIMSGKQLTENLGSRDMISGLAIMWAGLGFLVLVTLIIYGHLMKN
jgi:hypothetical protein